MIYKATGKSPINKERKLGPAPRIGFDAERMLKNWVKALAVVGFPVTKANLLTSVKQILKDRKEEHLFPGGTPGTTWLKLFLKRNPDISERTVEKLSKVRANVTESFIKSWYHEIEDYVQSQNLKTVFADPSRIFNMDETAFFLSPRGEKVLAVKGQKNVYEVHSGSDKENITVLVNVSASGEVPPPLIVFAGQRFPPAPKLNVPNDWAISKSESGWINGEIFFEYFVNYFYPWLVQKKVSFPVIVFLDGHKSHLTYHLSKFCSERDIVLIALPANCTHVMQPLDVAVFRPVKRGWAEAVRLWRMDNDGDRLTKFNFAPLLQKVLDQSLKKETIVNGFRRCGLCPFDKSQVDYSKVDIQNDQPSTSTSNEPMPSTTNENNSVCQENVSKHNEGKECLEFLESFIAPETLTSFENTYKAFTPIWNGKESAHDLYVVWKKAKDHIQNSLQGFTMQSQSASTQPVIQTADEISPSKDEDSFISTPGKTNDGLRPNDTADNDDTINDNQLPNNVPVALNQSPTSEKLCQVLSPETNGANVPSPFKKNLFWPGTPTKTKKPRKAPKVKLPSVVSSQEWRDFEEKKKNEKKKEEERKNDRKRKREENKTKSKNGKKRPKGKPKKKLVYDQDEDWICKVCGGRYSAELIVGTSSCRRWIECDECENTYHYKCIPKKHLNVYGIEESDEDEDELNFVCHNCTKNSDDEDMELGLLLSENDDDDIE